MRHGSIMPHKMRSPAFPPRRPSAILRYLVPAFVLITLFYYLRPAPYDPLLSATSSPGGQPPQSNSLLGAQTKPDPNNQGSGQLRQQSPSGKTGEVPSDYTVKQQHEINQPALPPQEPISDKDGSNKHAAGTHPIDRLIANAEKQWQDTVADESHSLAEAAAAYRKKRGRHPPPGFDQWYKFAADNNAVMVESFWDQIYHDLEPFWALPANEIRKGAWDYEMTINVRDGVATAGSDWFWTQIWLSLVQTIQHLLPDMDIALNAMDEPRLVVPWETINEYMNKASASRGMVPAKDAVNTYEKLAPPGQGTDKDVQLPVKEWEGTKPYWKVVRRGCSPDSATRKAETMTDFDHAPIFTSTFAEAHMDKGFVANYTLSTNICHQPDLQGLNGMFIEPLTVSATKTLFPMFGGSKLSVNNEILLPAPMYWNEEERFTGGGDTGVAWPLKYDGVIWRGVATGGKNRADNWRAFQRHRFVAMNNATKIARAEDWTEIPANFELPSPTTYNLAAQKPIAPGSLKTKLANWVGSWSDVAFVDLMCEQEEEGGQCSYTSPHFAVQEGIKLADQFNWKYLPDIDGNSFSGRYLGFLRSTSLPIKATVYREWHDSRLLAWKHFVPMDNRFSDWFGIMEYFLGYDGMPGSKDHAKRAAGETEQENKRLSHDAAAEKIATEGKAWAEKVLRREDMQIYVLRLLLEYARVSDERREKMGWVGDLI